jgi:hypothetical protein
MMAIKMHTLYPLNKKNTEIQFRSDVHIAPLPKRNRSVNNFWQKKSTSTSPKYMCIRQVLRKSNISYGLCKKRENLSCEKPYLYHRILSFLHALDDKSIFHEITLWVCSTWRRTCEFFVPIFFTFQNMRRCISKSYIYSHEPKYLQRSLLLLC